MLTASPKSERAPRTNPADRRQQLLDTAEEILAASGSDALRMDALARAAGVTRPVVYDHFGDRSGLIVALLERHAARVAEFVRSRVDPEQPFATLLHASAAAYLEVASTTGRPMRALANAEFLSSPVEAARSAYWDTAVTTWATHYRRESKLTPRAARALAASHLAGLSTLAGLCADGELSVRRATELHVTSTLAALESFR